jgi:hypothetical protein
VREQATFLKDVADTALPDRTIDMRLVVEQYFVVERDSPPVGSKKPGNHVDDAGFAGAGCPEKGSCAAFGFESRVERKIAKSFFDVD